MPHNQTPYETLLLLQTSTEFQIKLEVHFQDGAYWMNQKQLAALFGVGVPIIAHQLHIIYKRGELEEASTSRKIRISQQEGRRQISREIFFYSFETVIAIGYRLNSTQASQFRIWMTSVIKLFLVKGFVVDDTRLQQAHESGKGYFLELLERMEMIREG